MEEYLLPIPFIIFGGIVIWVMIFLGTYPHFPKMDRRKRIELSLTSATTMALILIILVYLFTVLIINQLL